MGALGLLSGYSFHEAAWGIEELVAAVGQGGYGVVGLSDWGGFWGGVECSQRCAEAGLGLVLGCRLKVLDWGIGEVQWVARERAGYGALSRLCGRAGAVGISFADLVELQEASGGEVWLSVPLRVGERVGRVGMYQRWLGAWERLEAYGWDNVWLELGWANEAERVLQRRLYGECWRRGWRRWVVQAGARHAGGARRQRVLEVLQAIGTLTRVGQVHPDKLAEGDYGLLPAAELWRRYARVPWVLESTRQYMAGCRFDYPYGQLFLPKVGGGVPRGSAEGSVEGKLAEAQLRRLGWLCLRGLVRRYGRDYPWGERPRRELLLERLGRELGIVAETGYAGYFLIFAELVAECGRRRIPVLARGSAAGSLICYALGVSNVCPFRFGLCFERFLNIDRMRHSKLPDIDLDLPWDRRDEMMEWVRDRYGENHVAMIGGFAHFNGRAAVAEVAMALGIAPAQAHAWSKSLPHGSLRRFLARMDGYREAEQTFADGRFAQVLELALELHGLPRHPMMHPCGMVISERDLRDFTPLVMSAKGFPMTQLAMDPIEDLGLLKMDLLGQAGLSVLRDCEESLLESGAAESVEAIWAGIDYGDARIFAMIRSGGARGVFHIESPAMTGLLRLCRCADLDCLVATVSVIRPGAANEDKKTRFALRYLGLEAPVYAHPVLEEVLGETYGLMVYEEHILLVANRFAGMDLGTADRLRRLLIKKSDDEALEDFAVQFAASARRAGRSEPEIAAVWQELRSFSGFMFNKAHGAAYAVESFRGCWLKYRWPAHFLVAVLNNRRGFYDPLVYRLELQRHGVSFILPDVQALPDRYQLCGWQLRFPLWQIRGIGEAFLGRWQVARQRGPFAGWEDFCRRVGPTRDEACALARCGALRSFFTNRNEAAWHANHLPARGPGSHPAQVADLFGPSRGSAAQLPEPSARDCALAEAELLGFPVTEDPFALWLEPLDRHGTTALADIHRFPGRELEVAGLIVCSRLHRTLKGEWMKFLTLADPSGMAELVLFPAAYQLHGAALRDARAARLRIAVPDDSQPNDGVCRVVDG